MKGRKIVIWCTILLACAVGIYLGLEYPKSEYPFVKLYLAIAVFSIGGLYVLLNKLLK